MPERSPVIRSLMPLVFLGFLIVGTALLCVLWPPSAGDTRTSPVNFRDRVETPGLGSRINAAQRILDLSLCLVVIVGMVLLFVAWAGHSRGALVGLITVGVLGVFYGSGMALYAGPTVSICGFMLILFGGLVAWVASSPGDASDELSTTYDSNDSDGHEESVDITTNRTNDHASQSAA